MLRKCGVDFLRALFLKTEREGSPRRHLLSSREGQVALVLILLAALGLVFFAMSLNYSNVSAVKNRTMIAAQSASSVMASYMASYAQQLSEEFLKGRLKYCKKTSVFKAIVVLIIMIILTIISMGALAPLLGQYVGAFIVASVMAAVTVAIDMAVIQPMITNMWNREMQKLSPQGYVIELGIQYALMAAVNDNGEFPDILDFNMDGIFGWEDPARPWLLGKDSVSRFAIYYTDRLRQISGPDPFAIEEFARQLRDFIYYTDEAGDSWGLNDPVLPTDSGHPCNSANPPAECNPACFPTMQDSWCCDIKGCDEETAAACSVAWTDAGAQTAFLASPEETECCYSCWNPPDGVEENLTCEYLESAGACPDGYLPGYPHVFDPFYENTLNSRFSLRERIGRDDESPFFEVNPDAPDWHANAAHQQMLRIPAPPDLTDTRDAYRVQDAGGFWQGDSQVVDGGRPGVYPFFYAMQDIGVELSSLSYAGYECYWQEDASCDMDVYQDGRKNPTIPPFLPLSLGVLNGLSGNNEVRDLGAGGTSDIVRGLNIFLDEDECGHFSSGEAKPEWKRGSDRFCSTTFPYEAACAKHSANGVCIDPATGEEGNVSDEERDCFCWEGGAGDTALFPEDFLEEMYYGIPMFLDWAQEFLSMVDAGRAAYLHKTASEWYDSDLADWIEPPCPDPAACPGSVTKQARAGILYQWRNNMEEIYNRLTEWIFPLPSHEYTGGTACLGANAVWCVPGADCGASSAELETFDVNANGIRGDMEDVVACLNWNANDMNAFYDRDGNAHFAVGNAEKFDACSSLCGPWSCSDLPRSLVTQSGLLPFVSSDRDIFWDCYWTSENILTAGVEACDQKCGVVPGGYSFSVPFNALYCQEKFDGMLSIGGQDFFDSILAGTTSVEVTDGGGSCDDPAFLNWAAQSADAAENQVIKLRQRHTFLQYLLDEGLRVRGVFGEAVDRFDEFLNNNTSYATGPGSDETVLGIGYIDENRERVVRWSEGVVLDDDGNITGNVYAEYSVDSPAELVIAVRNEDDPDNGDTASVVVYVWRGDDLEEPRIVDGLETTMGYVHAVKVEVRAPGRCNSACGTDRWPWIKTSTSGANTKRCYHLRNFVGAVKARVIRYDEPVDTSSRFFRFANNVPIFFGLRTTHPDSGSGGGPGGMFAVGSDCYNQIHSVIRGIGEQVRDSGAGSPQYLHHAFMLNHVPYQVHSENVNEWLAYDNCWQYVHENLLEFGVHSESCAQYRWEAGTPEEETGGFSFFGFFASLADKERGNMGVRFVPCDEGFLRGEN